mgnify:CR=1 FL=1
MLFEDQILHVAATINAVVLTSPLQPLRYPMMLLVTERKFLNVVFGVILYNMDSSTIDILLKKSNLDKEKHQFRYYYFLIFLLIFWLDFNCAGNHRE